MSYSFPVDGAIQVDENVPYPSTPQILFEEPIISHHTTARLEVSYEVRFEARVPYPGTGPKAYEDQRRAPNRRCRTNPGQKGRELSVDQLFLPQRLWPGVQPTQVRRKRKQCEARHNCQETKKHTQRTQDHDPAKLLNGTDLCHNQGGKTHGVGQAGPHHGLKQAPHRLPDGGVTILRFRERLAKADNPVHDRCDGNHRDDRTKDRADQTQFKARHKNHESGDCQTTLDQQSRNQHPPPTPKTGNQNQRQNQTDIQIQTPAISFEHPGPLLNKHRLADKSGIRVFERIGI